MPPQRFKLYQSSVLRFNPRCDLYTKYFTSFWPMTGGLQPPSLIAICDRESNGKQHDETPTVHKAPSLPLRPMLRTSQPPESDTARRPLTWRRGFQPRHSQVDAASPCAARPLTTSLTRHILPNSETPNSDSNHIAAVEIREAPLPTIGVKETTGAVPDIFRATLGQLYPGGPSLRDGHSQYSHGIKYSGTCEKNEWNVAFW